MKANQANQLKSKLGKDNVSKKPLDAAKNKLNLLCLFFFNTKFSRSVTRFYLGYTFGIDLHARKISLVWLTIIIKLDLEADILESMLKYNQGSMFIESSKSKVISCFFRNIFISNARHVQARFVLRLSFHLSEAFFGIKRY
jgi:hypothetical protein